MIRELIQYLLIDHLAVTGIVTAMVCGAAKVWILYRVPSHPLYRGTEAR